MESITLYMPFEIGNLIIWLWLEVLALGCLILWTTNAASIVTALYFKHSCTLRLRARRSLIDWLPLNGDLRVLPTVPKLIITIIRALVSVVVAVSALGIDPGNLYTESQRSTHVVSATNQKLSGRAYDSVPTDSLPDFAVVACEDVTVTSVVKFMAFISSSEFSCNFGRDVGQKKTIAEVIWHQGTVREIANGQVLPVDIKLGEKSAVLKEESNATFVRLRDSEGAPVFMSVIRRSLRNSTFGACEDNTENDTSRQREYMVFSNGRIEDAGHIGEQVVSVAYVICKASAVVPLRDTDRMIFLPRLAASQQMILARRVAEALISITADDSEQVFLGRTKRVTKLKSGFDQLLLALTVVNVMLLVVSAGLLRYVKRGVHVDVFSPVSMYWLGHSSGRKGKNGNKKVTEDVLIRGHYTANGIEISASSLGLGASGYMIGLIDTLDP